MRVEQFEPFAYLLACEAFHLPDRDVAVGLVLEHAQEAAALVGAYCGELRGRFAGFSRLKDAWRGSPAPAAPAPCDARSGRRPCAP